ncbi:MAG: carbon storage regulator [Planctomycetota bacterium]|nr:MAG: carbon storage regulator [Planctomycetota bacterium]REJ96666.1 MAG: carbon storage regulator [Planctomycetota bacterium]REK20079.1 MAG: carbon storage regulator [Planctomycetota bacterium]REK28368.1 MAG: carbon storage regulator [Planctomycetota bacterium]
MLVLTRKKNEMIQIGESIVIKVISTGRGKVKLGIDAPADIRVLRAELAGTLRPSSAGQSADSEQPHACV